MGHGVVAHALALKQDNVVLIHVRLAITKGNVIVILTILTQILILVIVIQMIAGVIAVVTVVTAGVAHVPNGMHVMAAIRLRQ